MDNSLNLVQLIRILLKWKWHIAAVTILAGIVSVIVALFVLPVYYKSHSTFYPVNQGVTDRANLFSSEKADNSVDYYGTKKDLTRLEEIAYSSPITDFMINWFHLADHYGIDTTSKYWRTKVKKKFMKNYEVKKTKNDALSVTIHDPDPAQAAEMVNLVIEKIDEMNKKPVVNSKFKIRDMFADKVKEKEAELNALTDSLGVLAERYKIKVQVNAEGANIITGPSTGGVEIYKVAQQKHESALTEFNTLKKLYEQYDVATLQNVASVYIVEEAYPADKKSRPVRWLVCVSTVLVTFFVAIMGAILFEQVEQIRKAL